MLYRVSAGKKPAKILESFDLALAEISKDLYIGFTSDKKEDLLIKLQKYSIIWFNYGFTTATIEIVKE